MTPRQKALRTSLQVLAGLIVLAGPLVAALGLAATTVAAIAALLTFAAGAVALVQNTLEENGYLPRIFGRPRVE
jgi:hypothetical protein